MSTALPLLHDLLTKWRPLIDLEQRVMMQQFEVVMFGDTRKRVNIETIPDLTVSLLEGFTKLAVGPPRGYLTSSGMGSTAHSLFVSASYADARLKDRLEVHLFPGRPLW